MQHGLQYFVGMSVCLSVSYSLKLQKSDTNCFSYEGLDYIKRCIWHETQVNRLNMLTSDALVFTLLRALSYSEDKHPVEILLT